MEDGMRYVTLEGHAELIEDRSGRNVRSTSDRAALHRAPRRAAGKSSRGPIGSASGCTSSGSTPGRSDDARLIVVRTAYRRKASERRGSVVGQRQSQPE